MEASANTANPVERIREAIDLTPLFLKKTEAACARCDPTQIDCGNAQESYDM
jgi:hypothetical protein